MKQQQTLQKRRTSLAGLLRGVWISDRRPAGSGVAGTVLCIENLLGRHFVVLYDGERSMTRWMKGMELEGGYMYAAWGA